MNLNYNDEQVMLKDGISRFVSQEYTFEKRRAQIAERDTLRHWASYADMGWLLVPFDEAVGGLSGSAVDTALVMEEFGKGLVVEPYLANTVLAGGVVAKVGNEAQKAALLEPLMAGELRLALAIAEPDSRYHLAQVQTTAAQDDANWHVNGSKATVLGGDVADKIIVPVRTSGDPRDENGITLLLVDTDAPGVTRRAYPTVDGQGAADFEFHQVTVSESDVIGEMGGGFAALSGAVDRATLSVAAEAVGAMQSALEITLDYTRTRKQFGVPIASFQALQHRMVEMLIEIEQSRSIVLRACLAVDAADPNAGMVISAAKARVGRAAQRVGEEAVQLHGGIGVTEEYSIGHYLKRLTAIRYSFGSTDYHRQRYVAAAAA